MWNSISGSRQQGKANDMSVCIVLYEPCAQERRKQTLILCNEKPNPSIMLSWPHLVLHISTYWYLVYILGGHVEHTINKMPPPPTRQLHMKAIRATVPGGGTLDMRSCHVHRLRMRQIFRSNMLELYRFDCDRFASHPLNASTLTYFRQEHVPKRNKCVCLQCCSAIYVRCYVCGKYLRV